ncbi:hypothetical protein SUGI_0228530 [Cryptomeria japonica]|uniref:cyclin-A3-1 n=1 Tax=Cryptomeria japonica TaxID=3369 RepID=UPI002408B2A0|nr:cyclin-A3-1 [Cryptomeria japonica]GLJ14229.1 hypothetical protein SUGI_0228530 [Cryptomeria japonica]
MCAREEERRAPITRARAAAVEKNNRSRSTPPKRAAQDENGRGNAQPQNKRRAVLGDVTNTVLALPADCSETKGQGNKGKDKKKVKARLRKDAKALALSTPSDEIVAVPPAVEGKCIDEIGKAQANESEKAKTNESDEGNAYIDGGIREDPQMCSSYVQDIYNHLRIAELKKKPKSNFMETLQKDITPNMRGILIDWLVEVSEEYKLVPDTLYLTVGYIDRFLSVYPVSRHKLQLLGVTCMLIASKYEEICPPHIEEFCYITDNTYTREEMVTMERNILTFLHFEMTMPTIKTFLRRFVRASHLADKGPSLEMEFLSNYLAELTLLECSFLKYLPSLIAAAAVYLSLLTLDFKTCPWNSALQQCTGYKPSQLKDCVTEIYDLQTKRKASAFMAIREKYRQLKFKRVANLRPPASLPQSFFEDIAQ